MEGLRDATLKIFAIKIINNNFCGIVENYGSCEYASREANVGSPASEGDNTNGEHNPNTSYLNLSIPFRHRELTS